MTTTILPAAPIPAKAAAPLYLNGHPSTAHVLRAAVSSARCGRTWMTGMLAAFADGDRRAVWRVLSLRLFVLPL